LWIWATLYQPERGWGMQQTNTALTNLKKRPIYNASPTLATLNKSWRPSSGRSPLCGEIIMDLLIILTYVAIAWSIFKIFKIPVNKWTLPPRRWGRIYC
jgi:hypothetical protein